MGMEAFTISISSKALPTALREFFLAQGFLEIAGPMNFKRGIAMEIETDEFIVEALISDHPNSGDVDLRYALSNPDSVDGFFRTLVQSILHRWPSHVSFISGTQKDLDFAPEKGDAMLLSLEDQMPKLRAIWQSRAGTKIGRVRVAEVSKFMGWI